MGARVTIALHFNRIMLVGALVCGIGAPATAQQLLDNWNTDACGFTDVVAFSLDRTTYIQRIDIWYRWGANEASVRYSIWQNGAAIAEGNLARADCDPYQPAWCIARLEAGADLNPGTYVLRTAHARICQNAGSQGQGFIRAFGAKR
jgi:hypothetical protein